MGQKHHAPGAARRMDRWNGYHDDDWDDYHDDGSQMWQGASVCREAGERGNEREGEGEAGEGGGRGRGLGLES